MKQETYESMTKLAASPLNVRKRVAVTLRVKIGLGLLVLGVGLAGCGSAKVSRHYQLTVPGNIVPAAEANPVPVTLLIGRLAAPALYHEDQIVYSSGGQSMGTYEYQRWSEPPTDMIAEVMLRQLRASGHYRGVYVLRSDLSGDYLLHGHLYDFKEISGPPLVGRVTMELELRNVKTGNTVWTHFYTRDEPAAGKEVGAVVAALDKNVQQGIAEFRASLDQYFAEHPPGQPARTEP